jgi:CheY-like chemotaxis protein
LGHPTLLKRIEAGGQTARVQEANLARALVVDDDYTLRFVMMEILRQAGYHPVEAENGRVALDILKQTPDFDVILSDIQMPHLDGIGLLDELKTIYPGIPVIMLSINPTWNTEVALKGAVACLPKPFSRQQLLDAVRSAAAVELAGDLA